MSLHIPNCLASEHESQRVALRRVMRESGRTGEMARRVGQLMEGHMMREEKFALRPLGLLEVLSRGETPAELGEAERLAGRLRDEVAQMRDEHRQLAELLGLLAREAEAEGHPEHVELVESLVKAAQFEEEILYPAALLVGAYARKVRSL